MPQAKTLSEKELKIVLATVAQGRYAARNRAMVLMSFWAGMRAGELAALRIGDVVVSNGTIGEPPPFLTLILAVKEPERLNVPLFSEVKLVCLSIKGNQTAEEEYPPTGTTGDKPETVVPLIPV